MGDNDTRWDDNELMDCKDIFIKMMDFIRNYDAGTEEYTRRIRFSTHDAVNDLAKKVLEIGDLKFYDPKPKEDSNDDIPIRSSGLSRSKSDHRLVAELGEGKRLIDLHLHVDVLVIQDILERITNPGKKGVKMRSEANQIFIGI